MTAPKIRMATIEGHDSDFEQIERYLPSNYDLTRTGFGHLLVYGFDVAGWTLDDYVIPRLASGLYFAKEVTKE